MQAAWKFIKFATSTDRAAQWSLDTGYVATRQSCFDTDLIKDYYAEVPQASVAYEQLPYARPELTTYNAAEIWRVLNDNIQAAWLAICLPRKRWTLPGAGRGSFVRVPIERMKRKCNTC